MKKLGGPRLGCTNIKLLPNPIFFFLNGEYLSENNLQDVTICFYSWLDGLLAFMVGNLV